MTDKISNEEKIDLLQTLEKRFKNNMERHPKLNWEEVYSKLINQDDKLHALFQMEQTGGEPDVVGDRYVIMDCAKDSPKGRRSLCYDREALEARKKNKPETDAQTMAKDMGIQLLTEEDYRYLQTFGEFDLTTSSWVETPLKIRELGGAIFCDRRYDTVFTYHNGADSYYSARGFRGKIEL